MKIRLFVATIVLAVLLVVFPNVICLAEGKDIIAFTNSSETYGESEEIPADCREMLLYLGETPALHTINGINISVCDENDDLIEIDLAEYDLDSGVLRYTLPNGFPCAGEYRVRTVGLSDENGAPIADITRTVTVTGTGVGSTNPRLLTNYTSTGTNLTVSGCNINRNAGKKVKLDVYDKSDVLILTKVKTSLTGGKFSFSISVPTYGKYKLRVTDFVTEQKDEITVFVTETPCVCSANIKGEYAGNIAYSSSKIKFTAKIDALDAKIEDLIFNLATYSGETDITDIAKISTRNIDDSNIEITMDLSDYPKPYGFFALRVDLRNNVTGEHLTKNVPFSVANGGTPDKLNYKIGANCNFLHETDDGDTTKYSLFKNGGFAYARIDIVKGLCKDNYELNDTQKAFLEDTAEYGVIPYIDIVDQYSESRAYPPLSTEELDDWEQFVYRVVEQTKQYTKHYEVWNEYSLMGTQAHTISSGPDKGKPGDYVKLLERTYRAAKRADPECVIYGLSLPNITDTAQYTHISIDWAREVFRLGGGAYMDAVSIHPYTNYQSPENGNFVVYYDSLKEIMRTYGCGDKPIMASEYGWTSAIVSEQEQAEYLVRASAYTYDRLEKLLWYVISDKTIGSDFEKKFGITRRSSSNDDILFEAKPAYLALVNFNTMLNGYELKYKGNDGNLYDYEFTKNEHIIHMLWTKEGTCEYVLNTKDARVLDIYGNSIKKPEGNVYTISESPIYFETDKDNVICSTDFESDLPIDFTGFTVFDTNNEGYGNVAQAPSGNDYYWYTPIRQINSKALISFDYKNNSDISKFNIVYVRMHDKNGKEKNIELWNDNGKLNMYSYKIYPYAQLLNFEKKWYSFDFQIDFVSGRINGYVNGRLYDYWEISGGISDIYFFAFPRNTGGFYDNFRLTEYAFNDIYITDHEYKTGEQYVKIRFSESIDAEKFNASTLKLINTVTLENAIKGEVIIQGRTMFIPVDDFEFGTEYVLKLPENIVGITGKPVTDNSSVFVIENKECPSIVPMIDNIALDVDFEHTSNLWVVNSELIAPLQSNHGNVLNITTSETSEVPEYPTIACLSYDLSDITGKAIMKFDIKQSRDTPLSTGYKLQLVARSMSIEKDKKDVYITVSEKGEIALCNLKPAALGEDWHTVTLSFDYISGAVTGWLDSGYLGQVDMNVDGNTYYPQSFHVLARKNSDLEFQLDNFRVGTENDPEAKLYARGFRIIDADGTVLDNFEAARKNTNDSGSVYASAYLVNMCDTDQTAKIIIALYQNKILKSVKMFNASVPSYSSKLIGVPDDIRVDLPENTDNCSVKAFCWDSEGMVPLHEASKLENE